MKKRMKKLLSLTLAVVLSMSMIAPEMVQAAEVSDIEEEGVLPSGNVIETEEEIGEAVAGIARETEKETETADQATNLADCADIRITDPYYSAGQAVQPTEYEVYDGEKLLYQGTEYTVSFPDTPANIGGQGILKIDAIENSGYTGSAQEYYYVQGNAPEVATQNIGSTPGSMKFTFDPESIYPDQTYTLDIKVKDTDIIQVTKSYTSAELSAGILIENEASLTAGEIYDIELYIGYPNADNETEKTAFLQTEQKAAPAQKDISAAVVGEIPDVIYNAATIATLLPADFEVTYGEGLTKLTRGNEYLLSVQSPAAIGIPGELLLTGNGDYTGEQVVAYEAGLDTPQFTAETGMQVGEIEIKITRKVDGAGYYILKYAPGDTIEPEEQGVKITGDSYTITGLQGGQKYALSLTAACDVQKGEDVETVLGSEDTEGSAYAKNEDTKDIAKQIISVSDVIYSDQAAAMDPEFSVFEYKVELTKLVDYTVEITRPTEPGGSGTVVFTGIGKYNGSTSKTYKANLAVPEAVIGFGTESGTISVVLTKAVAGAQGYLVTCTKSSTADSGSPEMQEKKITDSTGSLTFTGLTPGEDYQVSVKAYYNNVYSEAQEEERQARPAEKIQMSTVDADITDPLYNGGQPVVPTAFTLTDAGNNKLENNIHYTVRFTEGLTAIGAVGTAVFTAVEGSDYTGVKEETYHVDIPELSFMTGYGSTAGSIKITMGQAHIYDGYSYQVKCSEKTAEIVSDTSKVTKTVTAAELKAGAIEITGLDAGVLYEVEIGVMIADGENTVLYGANDVDQTARAADDVKSLQDAIITSSDTPWYEATPKLPSDLLVKYSGNSLRLGTDYEVTFNTVATPGKSGELKISGIGIYSGSQTWSYDVKLHAPTFTADKGTTSGTIVLKLPGKVYGAEYYKLSVTRKGLDTPEREVDIPFADSSDYTLTGLTPGALYSLELRAACKVSDGMTVTEETGEDASAEAAAYTTWSSSIGSQNIVVPDVEFQADKTAMEPEVTITDGTFMLEEDTHYEITSITTPTVPGGTGAVVIKALGSKYTGTTTRYYKAYLGSLEDEAVNVVWGTDPGSIKVSILSGQGVYGANACSITWWNAEEEQPQKQSVEISGNSGSREITGLVPDVEYEIEVTALYKKSGAIADKSKTAVSKTIKAKPDNSADLGLYGEAEVSDAWYTGEYVVPYSYKISLGGTELREGTDYTVSYPGKGRELNSTGSILFTGIGAYSGTKTEEYSVVMHELEVTAVSGRTAGSIKVTFKPVAGAVQYDVSYVSYSGDSTEAKLWKTLTAEQVKTQNTWEITGLTAGEEYGLAVEAYYLGDGDILKSGTINEEASAVALPYRYLVKYVSDGKIVKQQYVDRGEYPDTPEDDPVKKPTAQYAYEFSCWTPDEGEIYKDTVYTAVFDKYARTYTLKYDRNGGKWVESDEDNSTELDYGDVYDYLPECNRAGYTFAGWYTAKNGGSRVTENTAFRAVGARNSVATIYAHWTKVTVPKVSLSKLNLKTKKSIKATWKKITGANGYEIKYSLKSNMKGAKVIKATGTSATIKKLKSKKKYYVQVRAWKKDSTGKKVYGAWSAKKNGKVK